MKCHSTTQRAALALLVSAAGSVACVDSDSPEGFVTDEQALHSTAGTYLRCGATSTRLNAASRLEPLGETLAIEFEVAPGRVLERGDFCILTVQRAGGHGRRRVWYTTGTRLEAPGESVLQVVPWPWPFQVTYPAAGRYRATFDPSTALLRIAPLDDAPVQFSEVGGGFGRADSYAPSTPARWSVKDDQGNARYAVEVAGQTPPADATLVEQSLFKARDFADFRMELSARAERDAVGFGSLSVVYGATDADNYSYLSLATSADATRLVRVEHGVPRVLASATAPGLVDDSYHTIEVWRHGPWTRARVDDTPIFSINDSIPVLAGRVGVAASTSPAYFDDLIVQGYTLVQTDHFDLSLPDELSAYEPAMASLLENAYAVYADNTGWDLNARFGQARYRYMYRPDGWLWLDDALGSIGLGGGLPAGVPGAGGLTISGGPSAVLSGMIPDVEKSADAPDNGLVAITLHELGNGWALPGHRLPSPWVEWLRSEAHSGFLRATGELDLGYCADANREHADHYGAYLATPLDDRRNFGANVEPLLVSLREHYGFGLFRAVYDAAQQGQLDYVSALSSDDRDNELLRLLSKAAGEDLSAVLERELGLRVRDDVRAELSALAVSGLSVLERLPCHAPRIHATPASITLSGPPGSAQRRLYVQAPGAWTFRVEPALAGLSVQRDSGGQLSTLTLQVDAAQFSQGGELTADIVLEGVGDVPVRVPVRFTR